MNIYPFISDPGAIPVGTHVYKVLRKLENGGELTRGKDDGFDGFSHKDEHGTYVRREGYNFEENDYLLFSELNHPEAYKDGIYRLAGYIFDFRPFFKKYLVKWKHYGWQEHYAPNKSFIRDNATTPSHIEKIIILED